MNSRFLIVWAGIVCIGISLSFSQQPGFPLSAKVKITGTGQTTGHIANLSVTNTGSEKIVQELPPMFIPSGGQYQPYIVPAITFVEVEPNSTVSYRLCGFCVDIHQPPVPLGTEIASDVVVWTPSCGYKNIASGCYGIPGSIENVSPFSGSPEKERESVIQQTIYTGGKPMNKDPMDLAKDPQRSAEVLYGSLIRIANTFDSLKAEGKINTPFSGNPEKERESVIQQTFWIYASALQGKEYTREQFRSNTIKQYNTNMTVPYDQIKPEEKNKVEQGVADFWNTFEAVGVEAKVLKVVPD